VSLGFSKNRVEAAGLRDLAEAVACLGNCFSVVDFGLCSLGSWFPCVLGDACHVWFTSLCVFCLFEWWGFCGYKRRRIWRERMLQSLLGLIVCSHKLLVSGEGLVR
jgi:hypothetical protein